MFGVKQIRSVCVVIMVMHTLTHTGHTHMVHGFVTFVDIRFGCMRDSETRCLT